MCNKYLSRNSFQAKLFCVLLMARSYPTHSLMILRLCSKLLSQARWTVITSAHCLPQAWQEFNTKSSLTRDEDTVEKTRNILLVSLESNKQPAKKKKK